MSSFVLRQDYNELAKSVHSISGAITTVFLFTRLWAKTNKFSGLWRDDYILIGAWASLLMGNGLAAAAPTVYGYNALDGLGRGAEVHCASVTFMYLAIALSKTAFSTTLLRLTGGWIKAVIWFIIILVWAFNLALMVLTWLEVCDAHFKYSTLPTKCVSAATAIWVQAGNAACMLAADIALAAMPWFVTSRVQYIPDKERWAVATCMSLVGLSGLVGIGKIVVASYIPTHEQGKVDFTYGIVAYCCIHQGEAAIYIIAQALPILRVLLQGPLESESDSPPVEFFATIKSTKTNSLAADEVVVHGSVELLQLRSGRIVTAQSEEGRAFRKAGVLKRAGVGQGRGSPAAVGNSVNDEVHRIWADMGLSMRAWAPQAS